jgi:hypothetical protein
MGWMRAFGVTGACGGCDGMDEGFRQRRVWVSCNLILRRQTSVLQVVLPTFILERRSLLEMYADFFAHPDLFVR